MEKKYSHIVTDDITETIRFSDYAINLFPPLSTKSSVKKAIKKGLLCIDGLPSTTGTHIKKGQLIEYLEIETLRKIYEFRLEVIFEDDFFAIIHKPAGISVSGNQFKTIRNTLAYNLKKSSQNDAYTYPEPVHRLDNQTSGLLVIAKTHSARIELGNQFEKNEVLKTYHAVVIGKPTETGNIKFPIDDKGAETNYSSVFTKKSKKFGELSLIKLQPKTGRTHQLRIHCSESGFPILGDKLYGEEGLILKGKGLFLCATAILFKHPSSLKTLQFDIPYPLKFDSYTEREFNRSI